MEIKKIDEKPKMTHPQSAERVEVLGKLMLRIGQLQEKARSTYTLLRDRSPKEYWDDSVKRLVQYKQRPAYKQLWQANTANSTPADKLVSILSKLAGQPMETQVNCLNDNSFVGRKRERVLGVALKKAGRKNRDDYQLVLEMFAAIAKGTVIGFESWRFGKTTVRDVTDVDPVTGALKIQKRVINKWNDVWGEIVPIENFFPGNWFVRPGQIQDMGDCAMRKVIKLDKWKSEFGGYPDADKVQSKSSLQAQAGDLELFYKFGEDVSDDEVEQWYYFNSETDEFMIIANGIWINPMGASEVQPLPWNHKKLPFWGCVFEPFAEDFLIGRSLADKLMTMADMEDALFDRILDQLALAIHKPIITRKPVPQLTKGFLHPGQNITIKGSGALSQDFATVDIQEPSQAHIQMLNIINQRLDSISVTSDPKSSTTRKTATQVMQEREAAVELVSLFLRLMEFSIRDKQTLRLSNIMQFYTLPVNQKSGELKFRTITLRNEKLTNGKIGTMEVQFTTDDIAAKQIQLERPSDIAEPIEKIVVTPSFIRGDWEFELEVLQATSVKQTETVKQAAELNFQQVMAALFPDKINRDAAFEDTLRIFKKDVKRMTAQTPEEVADMNPLETEGASQAGATMSKITEGLGGSLRQMAQR